MNLQAQPKASSKRTGKRISFFNEQGLPAQSKEQQHLKDDHLYGRRGNVQSSQSSEIPKTEATASSGTNSNHVLQNSVIFSHDQGEPTRVPQQMAPDKWQNRLPERSDSSWQPHPSQVWNHNVMYTTGQKGVHPANVSDYYNHHEALKRSQEKGVGMSQLDMYGDAVQQMLSQKAQLEQQALAMQHAHYSSILQAQKQQQQQQQQQHQKQQRKSQQQNQALPLQPFQLAFGHQGQKQGLPLPDLFHVFQETPAPSNAQFTAQQKQALPQMQLFENFYPTQQQQQAAAQAYSRQQAASMAQACGAPQHQMHMIGQYQQASSERSQGMLKALTEQNQQMVLPKSQISFPRRSRRLSKEGILTQSKGEGEPTCNPGEELPRNPFMHQWQTQSGPQMQHQMVVPSHKENYQQSQVESQTGDNQVNIGHPQPCQPETESLPMSHNGKVNEGQEPVGETVVKAIDNDDAGRGTGGVIQSTRRRRRISQEANLLTLAQKAVELASLQCDMDAKAAEDARTNLEVKSDMNCHNTPDDKKAREDGNVMPLIIPVSVPVKKVDPLDCRKERDEEKRTDRVTVHDQNMPGQKPSVIVTRQRFSRTNNTEPSLQGQDSPNEEGETPCRKLKQRPRPEPLFIPPKPGTFIVPAAYSSITPYQSHLRSPVRLADHPSDRNFVIPPYTPPPILSPVREGSGLYFNAILTASGHCVPPPFTPKSTPRTLLRVVSSDVTPPVLTAMGEATPVSIEPRINVGSRFQADIPELRDRCMAAMDDPMSDLLWQPWGDLESDQCTEDAVEALMTAACSSILPGGGTNQELAFHCLHEAKGNILAAVTRLLVKRPRRPRNHPLAAYHYTGSDRWTTTEKKLFNKGIAIYKKDFLLVQKLIKTKTVAQCVEFYYTYKKQVKIGRNGTLIFGDVDQGTNERTTHEEAEVDNKSSQRLPHVEPPRLNSPKEEPEVSMPKVVIKEEEAQVKIEEEFHDRRKAASPPKQTQILQIIEPAKDILIHRPQDLSQRNVEQPKEAPAVKKRKTRPPAERKKPETISSAPHDQEGSFPCVKCGRVFPKVKSRSAHMKSHAEQEKKAAALKEKQKEEAAAVEAAAAAEKAARSRTVRDESSGSSSSSSCSSNSSSCGSSDEGEIM
ncbi:mitotic deacetylase-associated SANT domain protein [Ambystoma mexicanum]|uniref:mitotic deacetylase-associated SANT domain protein n=1 Tax=Ambystoma mexicanum TaxID=8296 RepID=UPI0037E77E25